MHSVFQFAAEAPGLVLDNPGLSLNGLSSGLVTWVIFQLRQHRRELTEFRRESRHVRRVIAEKLNVCEADLQPPYRDDQ